jgi:hypothetical protein
MMTSHVHSAINACRWCSSGADVCTMMVAACTCSAHASVKADSADPAVQVKQAAHLHDD